MLWDERYCRRGNDVLISWDQKFQQKTEKIVYTIDQKSADIAPYLICMKTHL